MQKADVAARPWSRWATRRTKAPWGTPARIRLWATAAAVSTVAVVAVLAFSVGGQRDGLTLIGGSAGTEVVASSDLYFALNDMDAQLANVLLVGDEQNLGFTRGQALSIYEQRRQQADVDMQKVAAAAGDPASQQAVRDVLDELGGTRHWPPRRSCSTHRSVTQPATLPPTL